MTGKSKVYLETSKRRPARSPEDFWNLGNEKGFINEEKIVVKHGDILTWLKTDTGLGHVQANFIMLYLCLRTDDPKVSEQAKKSAYETGYLEYCPKN
ncbi:MAG: hypothetical protein ACXV2C_02300 [Candidatus Bathyarchaeia archaeon]